MRLFLRMDVDLHDPSKQQVNSESIGKHEAETIFVGHSSNHARGWFFSETH